MSRLERRVMAKVNRNFKRVSLLKMTDAEAVAYIFAHPVSGGAGPFSQITQGPASTTGVNTSKQSLIYDRQNGIVESVPDSGTTQALQTAIAILQAQAALTAVTTAQTLLNANLPAGMLNKLNRTLLITGTAIFTTAGTPQITIVLKLGAVTLLTIQTPAIGAAQTNGQIQFALTLSVASTGAAGTLEVHGSLSVQGGGTLAASVPQYFDQNIAVSSAVNLTAALALTATIASTVSLSSAQLRQGTIEVLN